VFIVIWTTTPWTMPGNRAISYSNRISYGLYEVTAAENDFGPSPGEKLDLCRQAWQKSPSPRPSFSTTVWQMSRRMSCLHGTCAHPLRGKGYDFDVPLLDGDHVTDDAGTGFVHTAPGHGREDFDIWMDCARDLEARGIDTAIPFTVGADGRFTADAPGFEGEQVITDKGDKGKANEAVIKALIEADMLFARGRLKHTYPHSWRSKKPVIFRNTPQWFVYMDRPIPSVAAQASAASASARTDGGADAPAETLREIALRAIDETRFVPKAGQNRLRGMIEDRPDWVLSRQRAWGVPIAVFVNDKGEVLKDEAVNKRIFDAFMEEGADAWFADGAAERFLGSDYSTDEWTQVRDILDVWFDSGSTHAFCLEQRDDLKWPADLYLEGSDQHRGWFHSSLLESLRHPWPRAL
jgi:isoleucyl-tRNA synthetase